MQPPVDTIAEDEPEADELDEDISSNMAVEHELARFSTEVRDTGTDVPAERNNSHAELHPKSGNPTNEGEDEDVRMLAYPDEGELTAGSLWQVTDVLIVVIVKPEPGQEYNNLYHADLDDEPLGGTSILCRKDGGFTDPNTDFGFGKDARLAHITFVPVPQPTSHVHGISNLGCGSDARREEPEDETTTRRVLPEPLQSRSSVLEKISISASSGSGSDAKLPVAIVEPLLSRRCAPELISAIRSSGSAEPDTQPEGLHPGMPSGFAGIENPAVENTPAGVEAPAFWESLTSEMLTKVTVKRPRFPLRSAQPRKLCEPANMQKSACQTGGAFLEKDKPSDKSEEVKFPDKNTDPSMHLPEISQSYASSSTGPAWHGVVQETASITPTQSSDVLHAPQGPQASSLVGEPSETSSRVRNNITSVFGSTMSGRTTQLSLRARVNTRNFGFARPTPSSSQLPVFRFGQHCV
jgi:hypothetical protein